MRPVAAMQGTQTSHGPTPSWESESGNLEIFKNLEISRFRSLNGIDSWEQLQCGSWHSGAAERRGWVGEAAEGGPGRPQTSRDTRRHLNNHTKALGRARVDQSCPMPNISKRLFLLGIRSFCPVIGFEIGEFSLELYKT